MTKEPIGIFDISETTDPALNEDWIKTPENRASERALHDELARTHGIQCESTEEQLRMKGEAMAEKDTSESVVIEVFKETLEEIELGDVHCPMCTAIDPFMIGDYEYQCQACGASFALTHGPRKGEWL